MTSLDRKCLLASTSAHASLALFLVIAPLIWATQQHQELSLPILTFIPSVLVDGPSSGGGSPTAKTSPLPPAAPVDKTPLVLAPPTPVVPTPAPPKPQTVAPKPEKPAVKVETEAPPKPRHHSGEPVPVEKKTEETSDSAEAKPTKHKIEPSFERESGPSKESKQTAAANARAAADAHARAAQRYAAGVNTVLATLAQGVSSGTTVDLPGPGGQAVGNYSQWVIAIYHRAWSPPSDLADPLATVTVQVVILRDGTVQSFKVQKKSGHSALDRSVQRLENVRSIAPFPEGAPDDRRTFIIDFNLRSKNS